MVGGALNVEAADAQAVQVLSEAEGIHAVYGVGYECLEGVTEPSQVNSRNSPWLRPLVFFAFLMRKVRPLGRGVTTTAVHSQGRNPEIVPHSRSRAAMPLGEMLFGDRRGRRLTPKRWSSSF